MRNLIRFFLKNHLIILFVILESVAFGLLVNHNDYQRASFSSKISRVTYNIFKKANDASWYIGLREQNRDLIRENSELKSKLIDNYYTQSIESVDVDSLRVVERYRHLNATVINNSTNKQYNYLLIDIGRKGGVEIDDAVISSKGIVGIVYDVSDNYAMVLSILNLKTLVSAKIKKNNYFGSIRWGGTNRENVILEDIPYHVQVDIGDTVVTSGFSTIFPADIVVGVVGDYYIEEGNFYRIDLKLANDFKQLSSVYVVKNLMKDEIKALEEAIVHDDD
ncbi:rod shape-determining protein MreC [Bacteroidales bacterium]|nr:rod shape-determining protein MreC [Bacteroidales bacterium]